MIDGGWAFDRWRGWSDTDYAARARAAAASFTGTLSPPPSSQQLYHVLEIALLDCLRSGLAEQLPVVDTLG